MNPIQRILKLNLLNRKSAGLILILSILSVNQNIISQSVKVPGVIIDYLKPSEKVYVGSPGICILPDGSYIASHDHFGPGSTEFECALTAVFRSDDKGKTWKKISEIKGQFWSNLFELNGAVYIMGTWKHHGNLVIRKSVDGGKTWTEPTDGKTGLLREGEYHTAPMPVLIWNNIIWRAVENAKAPTQEWGKRYSAMVFSASVNSDLLNSGSWAETNALPFNQLYLDGRFMGWLEGNAVADPQGNIVDMLRVATSENGRDLAAFVKISPDGLKASFDPATGFIDFAGGARKFSVRYDEKSKLYWTISNMISDGHTDINAGSVRNKLVLKSSGDLINWNINEILLYHPDILKHGFQYVDWLFDGKDIIYVSRTAFDDNLTGAANFHDANYMTFHRIKNFRKLSGKIIR